MLLYSSWHAGFCMLLHILLIFRIKKPHIVWFIICLLLDYFRTHNLAMRYLYLHFSFLLSLLFISWIFLISILINDKQGKIKINTTLAISFAIYRGDVNAFLASGISGEICLHQPTNRTPDCLRVQPAPPCGCLGSPFWATRWGPTGRDTCRRKFDFILLKMEGTPGELI